MMTNKIVNKMELEVTILSKKEALQNKITESVGSVLTLADSEGKLDYIEIKLSNHNGNFQMDYTLREKGKVY